MIWNMKVGLEDMGAKEMGRGPGLASLMRMKEMKLLIRNRRLRHQPHLSKVLHSKEQEKVQEKLK